jgi:hypothetical protein
MTTEVATVQNNQMTTAGNLGMSPWRQFANEETRGFFAGDLLKFIKGDWYLGEDKTPIGPTETFTANMNEIWRGWVRWWDGAVTDTVVGRIVDGFALPPRETLGDQDEMKWEVEPSGAKRDPWARTVYLVLRRNATEELVTFTSSSDGGRQAVGRLSDRFDRQLKKSQGKMPMVLLESETYDHKTYGLIKKPTFRIVDWTYWDTEASEQGDFNDPIADVA